MTAIVLPPARTVAAWAAPSMPTASPDTTVAPTATRFVAMRLAMPRPASVARRVPTMATAAASVQRGGIAQHEEDEGRHLDRSQPARVGDVVDRHDLHAERSGSGRVSCPRSSSLRRSRSRPSGPSRRGRLRRSSGPILSSVCASRSTPPGDAASWRIARPDAVSTEQRTRTRPVRGRAPPPGRPMRRARRRPGGDVRAGLSDGPRADRRVGSDGRVRTHRSVRRC